MTIITREARRRARRERRQRRREWRALEDKFENGSEPLTEQERKRLGFDLRPEFYPRNTVGGYSPPPYPGTTEEFFADARPPGGGRRS